MKEKRFLAFKHRKNDFNHNKTNSGIHDIYLNRFVTKKTKVLPEGSNEVISKLETKLFLPVRAIVFSR